MAQVESVDRQFGEVRIPMLVVMAGLPGAGKSTLAEIIGGRLAATIISVDPIEVSILRAGIASDQPTGLAAYLVAETMAEQVLLAGHSVVVDAVPPLDESFRVAIAGVAGEGDEEEAPQLRGRPLAEIPRCHRRFA